MVVGNTTFLSSRTLHSAKNAGSAAFLQLTRWNGDPLWFPLGTFFGARGSLPVIFFGLNSGKGCLSGVPTSLNFGLNGGGGPGLSQPVTWIHLERNWPRNGGPPKPCLPPSPLPLTSSFFRSKQEISITLCNNSEKKREDMKMLTGEARTLSTILKSHYGKLTGFLVMFGKAKRLPVRWTAEFLLKKQTLSIKRPRS